MIRRLARDTRAAVALTVTATSPMLLGFTALVVDAGMWTVGQTRLQVAADAGAMGASFLLASTTFKGLSATDQASTAQAVALAEAQGAMTKLMGTLTTPATVSVATDYSSVTVALTSKAPSFFQGIFGIDPPLMRASATASLIKASAAGNCTLALGSSGNAITVDNAGTLTGTGCTVASNANIYLNSGKISASKILAAGTITQSNSGSNTYSGTQTAKSAQQTDPYAGKTAPTPGACTTHSDYTKYSSTTYVADPGTWCGNQVIGGNSSSITFNPGVYIIKDGDLTFSNANIKSAAGVTFVLAGTTPGNFSWTNNSGTTNAITAPTTGTTAGVAIWQACNTSGTQTASFQGGGSLNISGTAYMPCAAADIGNYAQVAAPTNAAMTFIAKTVYVHGNAALTTTPSTSGGSSTGAVTVLTQ